MPYQKGTRQPAAGPEPTFGEQCKKGHAEAKNRRRYAARMKANVARLDCCIAEAEQMLADLRAERDACDQARKAAEAWVDFVLGA